MEGAHSDGMADDQETDGVVYVCVWATYGNDGDREREVQGCFGEDDRIGRAGGDVVHCGETSMPMLE